MLPIVTFMYAFVLMVHIFKIISLCFHYAIAYTKFEKNASSSITLALKAYLRSSDIAVSLLFDPMQSIEL